jgi:hypothetical protein
MRDLHAAATCRWAEPTLLLARPLWLEAWDTPWTCRRDDAPRPLESTESCVDCPRWEGRRPDTQSLTVRRSSFDSRGA